jgi:hypothetical protein
MCLNGNGHAFFAASTIDYYYKNLQIIRFCNSIIINEVKR